MTDEAKALVYRMRNLQVLEYPHDRIRCADLIETQAREIERKDAALRLFLALLDDPDYDFGELCEEFVPIARAALAGDSHD